MTDKHFDPSANNHPVPVRAEVEEAPTSYPSAPPNKQLSLADLTRLFRLPSNAVR